MILQRLYELARRENLLDDPAFETLPVRFAIQLGDDGAYLGLGELIGPSPAASPKAKGNKPAKAPPNRGKPLTVPLPHGSPNARGFARFFTDALSRVLPLTFDLKEPDGPEGVTEREKRERSRATFWRRSTRPPPRRPTQPCSPSAPSAASSTTPNTWRASIGNAPSTGRRPPIAAPSPGDRIEA